MKSSATPEQQSQVLTFFMDGEEYAVSILRVKEIIRYETVTRVPSAPRWIRGVHNLRGVVVPVVDLAAKFGLRDSPLTPHTCVVIVEVDLEGEHTLMGVMADAVSQVMELHPQDIREPPAFGTRVRVEYITGMGAAGKKFVLILDIDRVLSAAELLTVTASSEVADSASVEAEARQAPGPETP
jgi:purine-binding chemotaxis protein CheW